jgi:hypothetical protein
MNCIKMLKVAIFFIAVLMIQSFTTADNKLSDCPTAEVMEDWDLLGVRTVKDNLDRDEIEVTAARGVFTKLKFTVKGNPIFLEKMIVHYGNGDVWDHPVRFKIEAGSESREIDLPGDRRIIKKVVFWYEKANWLGGAPVVTLWGKR